MKKTPCEYMIWDGLPAIRKEIAESMVKHFGLSQRETAKKLGVTPSAICQYISNKRGSITTFDETIVKEITISAKRIIENEDTVIFETCRICKILRPIEAHRLKDSCDIGEK